jgi:ABC-2 type transport system permease protein
VLFAATLYGAIAKSAGTTLGGGAIAAALHHLGDAGRGAIAVLGLTALLMAILLAVFATSQIGAICDEELGGRLGLVLASGVSRTEWLCTRVLVVLGTVAVMGVAIGLGTWAGTTMTDVPFPVTTAIATGLHDGAAALAFLGIGALLYGILPRRAPVISWILLTWSALVVMVGVVGVHGGWVLKTSVFHYVSPAPAAQVAWLADGLLVLLGFAGVCGGLVAFQRRDLTLA